MNAPDRRWPAVTVPAMHFIANRFVASSDGDTLPVLDPSEGVAFAAIARGGAADVDRAVREAERARDGAWGRLAPAERGRRLAAVARAITAHAEELALLEARDCGKPLAQARADAAAGGASAPMRFGRLRRDLLQRPVRTAA